jgi:L-iditol 2-dehydrogenase
VKVSVWYNNSDIRLAEVPTPSPGREEILVKVMSCGICGSDVVEWYRLPRAPLVQGHEIGGEVVAVGDHVKKFRPGDRVFVAPKVPCMKCRYCVAGHYPQCTEIKERLPGGFAEYVLVPEILVKNGTYLLPENMSFDQGTFIEPLACVVRAQKLAGLKEGQKVLIIGCGMTGLLHVKLAKKKGCKIWATDVNNSKLEFAARIGADIIMPAGDDVCGRLVSESGNKADVVILCAAADVAVEQAWNCVEKGGVIVFFAVPGPEKKVSIPLHDFWTKEIMILTSYYCGPPDIEEAMKLMASGQIEVDDLITHRLPLTEIVKGFLLVTDGRQSVKVIIKPNEEGSSTKR